MTEDQEQMIDDCMKRERKLSAWEVQFVDNISNQETLSEKQDEILTKIWDRVTL